MPSPDTNPSTSERRMVLEPMGKVKGLVSMIAAQRTRINQLLVRQSLIEERARQTIGRAMHMAGVSDSSAEFKHFGILSIEQQIRGVLGSFELVSAVGQGTSATITVPLKHARANPGD